MASASRRMFIVALCQQHSVTELWTADRDFNRFQSLTIVNPLV
jgi:predicted nucleic acid-binding protein